jgi:asparagine N-glycosylation enzyme membrane subunit Stt3
MSFLISFFRVRFLYIIIYIIAGIDGIKVVLIMRVSKKKKTSDVEYLKRMRGSLPQLYILMFVQFLFSARPLFLWD